MTGHLSPCDNHRAAAKIDQSEVEVRHQHSVPITTRGAITVTLNSDKHHCTMIVRASELSTAPSVKTRLQGSNSQVVIDYKGQKQVLQ